MAEQERDENGRFAGGGGGARTPDELKSQYRQLNRSLADPKLHENDAAAIRKQLEGIRNELDKIEKGSGLKAWDGKKLGDTPR